MKKYFVCIGRTSTSNLFVDICSCSYENATLSECLRSAEQELKISLEPTYGQNMTITITHLIGVKNKEEGEKLLQNIRDAISEVFIGVKNKEEGEKLLQNIRDAISELFFYFRIPL